MKNLTKKRILVTILCFIVAFLMVNSPFFAQETSDEALEKKYAPILGEYEFVSGGQTEIIRFYIEEGDLWADSGDGRPATLEPVEDEKFSFTAQDPIAGTFEIKFMKDEQGAYTKCHIANTSMGIEVDAVKKK